MAIPRQFSSHTHCNSCPITGRTSSCPMGTARPLVCPATIRALWFWHSHFLACSCSRFE
ncbi:hypothetical protein GDO86_020544 [Hymenochirus boettgeri]|uniref:Uncharacterized protein n=1 Tax=Hymenochirus boettgeri TaxID=247094 RepID=A0A8T2ID08_9PIPI|nr:hypothetical protein GDO86_020544 [Hymenochirus boettgeri]